MAVQTAQVTVQAAQRAGLAGQQAAARCRAGARRDLRAQGGGGSGDAAASASWSTTSTTARTCST